MMPKWCIHSYYGDLFTRSVQSDHMSLGLLFVRYQNQQLNLLLASGTFKSWIVSSPGSCSVLWTKLSSWRLGKCTLSRLLFVFNWSRSLLARFITKLSASWDSFRFSQLTFAWYGRHSSFGCEDCFTFCYRPWKELVGRDLSSYLQILCSPKNVTLISTSGCWVTIWSSVHCGFSAVYFDSQRLAYRGQLLLWKWIVFRRISGYLNLV